MNCPANPLKQEYVALFQGAVGMACDLSAFVRAPVTQVLFLVIRSVDMRRHSRKTDARRFALGRGFTVRACQPDLARFSHSHHQDAGLYGRPRRVERNVRLYWMLVACLSVVWPAGETAAIPIGWGSARPWTTPGTNPCGELCDREWALHAMQHLIPNRCFRSCRIGYAKQTLCRISCPAAT